MFAVQQCGPPLSGGFWHCHSACRLLPGVIVLTLIVGCLLALPHLIASALVQENGRGSDDHLRSCQVFSFPLPLSTTLISFLSWSLNGLANTAHFGHGLFPLERLVILAVQQCGPPLSGGFWHCHSA